MFLFLTYFYFLFSIFLPLLGAERVLICPTGICYKVARFRQHLEAAEGERVATGPSGNKFLPFLHPQKWTGWLGSTELLRAPTEFLFNFKTITFVLSPILPFSISETSGTCFIAVFQILEHCLSWSLYNMMVKLLLRWGSSLSSWLISPLAFSICLYLTVVAYTSNEIQSEDHFLFCIWTTSPANSKMLQWYKYFSGWGPSDPACLDKESYS